MTSLARATPENWKTLTLAPGETPATVRLPVGPVVVPLEVWRTRRFELFHREQEHGWPLGLLLAPGEPLEAVEQDLHDFSLIVLQGDAAYDAPGQQAHRLRHEYGYRAELRVHESSLTPSEGSIAA